MKYYIVYVQFTARYEKAGLSRINRLIRALNVSGDSAVVIVENDFDSDLNLNCRLFHYQFKVRGSNSILDFSGYEEGLAFIKRNFVIESNDCFIFLNDTFFRARYFDGLFRRQFIRKIRESITFESPYFIGYKDKNKDKECYIGEFLFLEHFSTFFFVLNYAALEKLSLISINPENTKIVLNNEFMMINGERSVYADKVYSWIFKRNSDSWYRSLTFANYSQSNSTTRSYYDLKIFAVMNEHNLYVQASRLGIQLIPIFPDRKFALINILKSAEFRIIAICMRFNCFNYLR